jgi:hypothetical protein
VGRARCREWSPARARVAQALRALPAAHQVEIVVEIVRVHASSTSFELMDLAPHLD